MKPVHGPVAGACQSARLPQEGCTLRCRAFKWLARNVAINSPDVAGCMQGLGKTVQVIALLAFLVEARRVRGPFLVAAPASVLPNWAAEFAAWAPALRVLLYRGTASERAALLQDKVPGLDVPMQTPANRLMVPAWQLHGHCTAYLQGRQMPTAPPGFRSLHHCALKPRHENRYFCEKSIMQGMWPPPDSAMLRCPPRPPAPQVRRGVPRFEVLLTSYDFLMAPADAPRLGALPWRALVIDEGHRLKNAACRLAAVLRQYRAPHRLLLTGAGEWLGCIGMQRACMQTGRTLYACVRGNSGGCHLGMGAITPNCPLQPCFPPSFAHVARQAGREVVNPGASAGTPVQNSLQELWSLLNFLLPGLFASSDDFHAWFGAGAAAAGKPAQRQRVAEELLSEEEALLVTNRLHQVMDAASN